MKYSNLFYHAAYKYIYTKLTAATLPLWRHDYPYPVPKQAANLWAQTYRWRIWLKTI